MHGDARAWRDPASALLRLVCSVACRTRARCGYWPGVTERASRSSSDPHTLVVPRLHTLGCLALFVSSREVAEDDRKTRANERHPDHLAMRRVRGGYEMDAKRHIQCARGDGARMASPRRRRALARGRRRSVAWREGSRRRTTSSRFRSRRCGTSSHCKIS